MNAYEQILAKQVEWAKNRGLMLIGSQGVRGRKIYTSQVDENLFHSLNSDTITEFNDGDGGELNGSPNRPAKMQALHSSSALGVNIFDYWRGASDLSVISAACGLCRAGRKLSGKIRFEQKFSIDDQFQRSPNLDLTIYLQSGRYKAFGIECKFTEPYSSRRHGGLDRKYFQNKEIWQDLLATRNLARKISPDDNSFKYLHAAQLIKHILGMNRKFGHGKYRLLYLWYDSFGEPGYLHRQEIEEFKDVVRSDGVVFHEITYQELIINLAKHRKTHEDYTSYLSSRYL